MSALLLFRRRILERVDEIIDILPEPAYGEVTAIFDIIYDEDLEEAVTIMYNKASSVFSQVEIDGVVQDGIPTSYQFTTKGKHIVKYTLSNPSVLGTSSSRTFSGCHCMTSVKISDSVDTIPNYAFANCSSLKNIRIEDTVTSIGTNAFNNCSSLETIVIPDSVTSLGNGVLQSCASLKTATLPNGLTSMPSYLFQSDYALESIVIPETVTSIGANAFNSCMRLTSVTIPKNVTSIGIVSFSGCTRLNEIICLNKVPPTLANSNALINTNNCPIFVPFASVNAYKTAENWSVYADRIQGLPSIDIQCPSEITAESATVTAVYGDTILHDNVTWSIVDGSQYAVIDNNGEITISPSASGSTVVISCSYDGMTETKSVTLTYRSGSTSQTETEVVVNPDTGEISTITTTTTENQDGTSTTETTNVAPNGSSETITTNYNSDGDPVDGKTNTVDVQGNSNTQEVTYDENGDKTVMAYTIDTSGNASGTGEAINGDGINTEFVPWDNSDGWEMHIRFSSSPSGQPNPPIVVDTEDTGTNIHFTLLCAKSPFKPWPGFHIRWTLNRNTYAGNLVLGYTYSGATNSTNRNLAKAPTSGANANMYDFTISYDPTLKKYPSKFRCVDNFGRGSTISYNYNFDPIEYEFTIGYNLNQQGQPYRYSNLTVYEFTINKL